MNIAKTALGVALVAVIIAIGGYLFPRVVNEAIRYTEEGIQTFGRIGTNFQYGLGVGTSTPTISGTFNIGGGTNIARWNVGTCNLTVNRANHGTVGGGLNFVSSTTLMHFCSASGVQPGDMVFVTMPSGVNFAASSSPLSGPGMFGSISLVGAHASTTNSIGVLLENTTGVATSSYTQATTSLDYMYLR